MGDFLAIKSWRVLAKFTAPAAIYSRFARPARQKLQWPAGTQPLGARSVLMTTKELVIQMIERMPGDSTLADIMAELYLRQEIDVGLRQLDQGESLTQEQVEQRLSRWLS
jgi:hypothetical protein